MNTPPFDRRAVPAFIAVCAILLAGGFGFNATVSALKLYLKKEPADLRMPLSLISHTIGKWKSVGADRLVDAAIQEALGTDKYLDRVYTIDGGRNSAGLHLHLAYYTRIDTVPHVPDRCMVAGGFIDKGLPENVPLPLNRAGWMPDPEGKTNLATGETYSIAYHRELTGQSVPVRLPVGELKLRTVEFEREDRPDLKIFGGYFFIANGRATPTPEGVKALSFDPQEKYAYYCKVQYVYAAPNATREKFLELVSDHLQGLLPELMRCLPDWSEVERRTESTANRAPDAFKG